MKLFLKRPISKDLINLGICIVFAVMLIVWSFDQYLINDSYYYWRWSQHLDWSYFDGPPMIAYLIRLCAFLFSDSNLTLALINKVVLCLTCLVVYTTARQNLDKSASMISAMVCLFFPLSSTSIARGTTYDVPLFFFWALTLYFASAYANNPKRPIYLYATGAAIGLLMLSKYTGVVLVLGLLYSAARQAPLRSVFTNKHFYLSMGLALLLFSPVVWWNYQHEWVSFLYQLNAHKLSHVKKHVALTQIRNSVIFFTILNFLLFLMWRLRPKKIRMAPAAIQMQTNINWVCFWFNCLLCLTSQMHTSWFAPMFISLSLLCGYAYQTRSYRCGIRYYLIFWAMISYLFVGYQIVFQANDRRHIVANYLQNLPYQKSEDQFVLGDGWSIATALYPLQGQPLPKTLICSPDSDDNQYQYWNGSFLKRIRSSERAKIWYFSTHHTLNCLKKYFHNCRFFSKVVYNPKRRQFLHTYLCETPLKSSTITRKT